MQQGLPEFSGWCTLVSAVEKARIESFTCPAPRGAAGKVRPLQKITSDGIHKSGEIFVRNPIPGKVGRSMEGRARGVARGYSNLITSPGLSAN